MLAPAKTLNIRALYSNLLQYRAHLTHKIILYTIIAQFCWGRKCNLTVWFCSLLLKSCKLGSLGNSCVVNYSIAWSLLFLFTANNSRDGEVLPRSSGCAVWGAGYGSVRSSPRATPHWSCHTKDTSFLLTSSNTWFLEVSLTCSPKGLGHGLLHKASVNSGRGSDIFSWRNRIFGGAILPLWHQDGAQLSTVLGQKLQSKSWSFLQPLSCDWQWVKWKA